MKLEYLKQLTEQISEHPHITGDSQIENADWNKQNRPYVWLKDSVRHRVHSRKVNLIPTEFKTDFEAIEIFTDVGHGFHCCFINGQFQFMFKHERVFSHDDETYLVVNGPSFGVAEYAAIFKLTEKR